MLIISHLLNQCYNLNYHVDVGLRIFYAKCIAVEELETIEGVHYALAQLTKPEQNYYFYFFPF